MISNLKRVTIALEGGDDDDEGEGLENNGTSLEFSTLDKNFSISRQYRYNGR